MVTTSTVAEIGSLLGDPARVNMMIALLDDRAKTAGELAVSASVTPQTASSHLAKLIAAEFVIVQRQGRHRYHRLASPDVAHLLEQMHVVGAVLAGCRLSTPGAGRSGDAHAPPAYKDAGADVLYAPALPDAAAVSAVVRLAGDVPVNVLALGSGACSDIPTLASLGVRRISLGSALTRIAFTAIDRAIAQLRRRRLDFIRDAMSLTELDERFPATPTDAC